LPAPENITMNSVKVEIHGAEYRIRGDADPEHIQEIAHYVDSKMREVSKETSSESATTETSSWRRWRSAPKSSRGRLTPSWVTRAAPGPACRSGQRAR
jgi:hypothetical protein